MRELHVVALSEDGNSVLLAVRRDAKTGTFRVALNGKLSAALRGDLAREGETVPRDSTLTPKEIQARLRAGETAEEIATQAGVAVARVERFSGPVFSERERMIGEVRAAVLVRGRRGPSKLVLGEAVDEQLAVSAKPGSVRWGARREQDGQWFVEVSYVARGRQKHGRWLWDPAKRVIRSVDPVSAALGHLDALPAKPHKDRPPFVVSEHAPRREVETVKKSAPAARKAAPVKAAPAKKAAVKKPAVKQTAVKQAAVKQTAVKKAAVSRAATTKTTTVAKTSASKVAAKAPATKASKPKAPAAQAAAAKVAAKRAPARPAPVARASAPKAPAAKAATTAAATAPVKRAPAAKRAPSKGVPAAKTIAAQPAKAVAAPPKPAPPVLVVEAPAPKPVPFKKALADKARAKSAGSEAAVPVVAPQASRAGSVPVRETPSAPILRVVPSPAVESAHEGAHGDAHEQVHEAPGAPEARKAAPGKGRASVPAWADVLLGTTASRAPEADDKNGQG